MRRAILINLTLIAFIGCSESPRGHADPRASTETAPEATEAGRTTKIPMH